jgi:hypothetical protein
MLSHGFFNLSLSKKAPVVRIDKEFGGIRLTFSDNAGDELQVVLSPETFVAIMDWGVEFQNAPQKGAPK